MTGIDQTVSSEEGGVPLVPDLPSLKALSPEELRIVLKTMDRYKSTLKKLSEA